MYRPEIRGNLNKRLALIVITKLSLNKGITSKLEISLPSQIEAVLYLKGKPLTISEISETLNQSTESIQEGLIALMAGYSQRDTSLEISEKDGRYSLQLTKGLGGLVQNLLPVNISGATLRTLATIALKKRILQSDLVDLRGSGAYEHIKELVNMNFVERKRQRDGRSFWITLSEKFHQTFTVIPDIDTTDENKAA